MKRILKSIVVIILTLEARLVLLRYKPRIVGVTGSVGKSSTKDAIFTALSTSFFVRKNQKSFNAELGIPLTILGCDNAWNNPLLWLQNIIKGLALILLPNHYPTWLVLEVGLDRPGDIRRVVRWVNFDVVVYTKLSKTPVHVEFFDSADVLLSEKAYLMNGLKKDGVLIVNGDDPLQRSFMKEDVRRITYGTEEGAAVRGSHMDIVYEGDTPTGTTFRVNYGGVSIPIELSGVLGKQHVYPVLAGCAVGVSRDVNLVNIEHIFREHVFLPGRMRVLEGRDGSIIIDDSYNASPVATRAALETLASVRLSGGGGRKICMLGDMTELGKLTVSAHTEVGKHVARVADVFIAVGQRMATAADAARASGMSSDAVILMESSEAAGTYLRDRIADGDIALVKGSQAMRMERAVEKLLARPERARDLLVRQDREWLKRN